MCILTLHSCLMSDMRYRPAGETWFLHASICCLGFLALLATVPLRSHWLPVLAIGTIGVLALFAYLGPVRYSHSSGQLSRFPIAGKITGGLGVVAIGGYLAARRRLFSLDRHSPPSPRTTTWGAVGLGSLLALFFAATNYLLPRDAWIREVVRVNRVDGRIIWSATCDADGAAVAIHSMNTLASPSPVIDGERVYVHFPGAGVYCVDYGGNVLWSRADACAPSKYGSGSSPIVHGDLLIMTYDVDENSLTEALDKNTGKLRWHVDRARLTKAVNSSRDGYSTPIVVRRDGHDELVHCAPQMIVGYEPETGRQLWAYRCPVEQPVVSPVACGDLIILAGGDFTTHLEAVRIDRPEDGPPQVRSVWEAKGYLPKISCPVVYGGNLYAVTSEGGVASCRDSGTGKLRWKKRLGGGYLASLVAADGKVFCSNIDGLTTVIAADGAEYRELSQNDVGEPVSASLAIAHGEVFIRGHEHLYCVGKRSVAQK